MFKFCPKCKSLLKPQRNENDKMVLACTCGHTESIEGAGSVREEKKVKEDIPVEVVDSEIETLPITKEECGKCGNKEAYYWLIQTRAGDESETKFLKCTKCKHTWRDYS